MCAGQDKMYPWHIGSVLNQILYKAMCYVFEFHIIAQVFIIILSANIHVKFYIHYLIRVGDTDANKVVDADDGYEYYDADGVNDDEGDCDDAGKTCLLVFALSLSPSCQGHMRDR